VNIFIEDEAERVTPIGLFHFADSYWTAAKALKRSKARSSHRESPIRFLYYHSIELYLKAFLRLHGHTPDELRGRKFGHRTCCLTERAAELGLEFMDEDREVFSLMSTTDAIIRSRYLQTGFFEWPTLEALNRVCKSLRVSVRDALRKKGIAVHD
jgi:hypothetical protein